MVKYYLYENTRRHHQDTFVLHGTYDDKEAALKDATNLIDVLNGEREGPHHWHRVCTIIVSTKPNATSLADLKMPGTSSEPPLHNVFRFRRYL